MKKQDAHPLMWLSLPLALGATLMVSGCSDDKPKNGFQLPPPAVTVETVKLTSLPRYETLSARLEAKDGVQVRAQVSGQVQQQHFKAGQQVQVGQSLYDIDDVALVAKVKALQAQRDAAQSTLEQAQRELVRAQGLAKVKAISQQALEQAQDALSNATSQLQALQAQIRAAQLSVDYAKVKAPVGGIVSQSLVNVGDVVSAYQTVLTTIQGTDRFKVEIQVPSSTVNELQRLSRQGLLMLDAPMRFTMTLPDGTAYPVASSVDYQAVNQSPTLGTLDWKGEIDNQDQQLRDGMFVTVKVNVGQQNHVVAVPEQAVMHDPTGKAYVYVMDKDNKAVRHDVTIINIDHFKAIIASGLADGDRVIVGGLVHVRAGMTVRLDEPKQTAPVTGSAPAQTQPQSHSTTEAK